jgi:PAS domain S-box-containing protein
MGLKKKHTLVSDKKSVIKSPGTTDHHVSSPHERQSDFPKLQLLQLKDQLAKTANDKYYLLFNSISQGFCIIEMIWNNKDEPIDLRFLEVNAAFEKQTDIKNAVGRTMREIEPGIESHWYEIYGKVSKTGTPVHFEEKATALKNRWYNVYAFPLEDKSSKVAVLFDDITEQKKAEEQRTKAEKTLLETEQKYRVELQHEVEKRTIELKESKELLQNIADAIPDMISVQEYPSRKVIYFNREPYTISGLNADELSKKTIEDRHKLVHPEDIGGLQKYADSFKTLSNDDIATIEYRVKNSLNEWIWLSARGKVFERDEKGNVISIVAVVQNINAQKKGEEEIAKQHNILKQAEELAKIGSWEYNIKTKEFIWSDGMYVLFNMKRGKQVTPAIYLDHTTEKERNVAEKLVSVIERSFQPFEETIHLKIDGYIKAIKIKATPLKNNKGEPEKMLGVNMDITASLESAQKIMGLNESLLTMNKELNSLNSELRSFNSITANNYSEALRNVYINLETIITSDAGHLSDSGRANIRRAQSAVQRMKLLTNDIHNYLELYDAGIKKELISPKINLQDIIRRIKEKIEEANAKIEIEELPALSADPVLFSRLLTNLIDNSIKFKKPGEDPVIKIKHTKINEIKNVPVSLTGMSYKIITVTDNGIGFEITDKIFELFTKLQDEVKHKGSGMGLAICKKIMEMHGGYIIVEAEPGKGASFHCFFPE